MWCTALGLLHQLGSHQQAGCIWEAAEREKTRYLHEKTMARNDVANAGIPSLLSPETFKVKLREWHWRRS